jgi:phosphate-selective porin OprO/OprP
VVLSTILNLRMPQRTIFFAVGAFFASVFLSLAFQSEVVADPPSSGDGQTINGWLEKKIDWRPLGLHFYWKDGFNYEGGKRFELLEEAAIPKPLKAVSLQGRIGIKLDIDSAVFATHGDLPGFDSGVELRRARIYTQGNFLLLVPADFKVEFGIFGGSKFYLNDFYIRFNRDQYVNYFGEIRNKPFEKYLGLDSLQLGVFTPPMGLEALGSSENTDFLEVGSPTSAFAPGDRLGIQVAGSGLEKRLTWALGFFSVSTDKETGDASKSIGRGIGRVTLLPWYKEEGTFLQLLHLGASGSYVYSGTDQIRYQSRPESYLAPEVVDTGDIPSSKAFIYGLEGAWVHGPYCLQAEYFQSFVNDNLENKLSFKGYYVYGTYFITGESRPYDRRNGTFGRVRPKENFSWKERKWGAWEVGVRFSHLDLNDGPVHGGRMNILTGGLNWSPNPFVRVMFNYLRQNISNAPNYDGVAHTFTLRFQLYI